ncbi:MAG: hypothetical protein K0R63_1370 [Rickettsiales bacterium]|jgi:fermentation-respiration switch protein FrsA (DUF1100 family)|nr:hypothetical protein [Rickettsiales bacterium]
MEYFVTFLVIVELLYICVMAYMYVMQRSFIFKPEGELLPPDQYGLSGITDHILEAKDGIRFGTWFRKATDSSAPIIVYFHGNTGHIGDRFEKLAVFLEAGYGLCAPSYRGFGKSGGTPSESGLYADARATMEFLKSEGYSEKDLLLYGESLGSGVAVQMALEYPGTRALVLEAAYTAICDRASETYPFLPVYLLMKDAFDSLSKLPRITTPLLLFHGERDTVMPHHHGKRLLAAANAPKEGVFFPEVDHTKFDPKVLISHITRFIGK